MVYRGFLLASLFPLISSLACSRAPERPDPRVRPSASVTSPEVSAQVDLIAPQSPPSAVQPSVSPLAPLSPMIAVRTLRYREIFTGSLPGRAWLQTWTLTLGKNGRFSLGIERARAPENSLIDGKARPFGPLEDLSRVDLAASFHGDERGALDLHFDGGAGAPIHCRSGRVLALEAGATLFTTKIPGENYNNVRWKPAGRHPVDVLRCDRSRLADQALWSDEPQPERLLFADLPGVEYAHDNHDQVLQKGGIRKSDVRAKVPGG